MEKITKIRVIVLLIMINAPTSESGNGTLMGNARRSALMSHYEWMKCMAKRQVLYSVTRYETKAMAFLLSEGQSITLDAWLCLLPDQIKNVQVRWKFLALRGTAVTFLTETGRKYFVHENNKNLEINELTIEDSGFYFAVVGSKYESAVYFIEISDRDDVVAVPEATPLPQDQAINSNNLLIYLREDQWSPCSRCGRVGIQQKSAICFVKPFGRADQSSVKIQSIHYSIFDRFIGGLPCRSIFVPREIQQLQQVKDMKSRFIRRFCKVPCPTSPSTEDPLWKGVTTAKIKFFNFHRRNPLDEIIGRKTIFQAVDEGTIVTCPRKKDFDKPIVWRKNNSLIIPEVARRATGGRIIMDQSGRIRFRRLKHDDSGEYSCFANADLLGTVLLVVQDRFKPPVEIRTWITLATYTAILLTVLFLTCRVICNRRNKANVK